MTREWMLLTIVLAAAPAGAGWCVQSSGHARTGHYVLPENAAKNPADLPIDFWHPVASAFADAVCTNDPGLFSEVHAFVYEDATVVDLVTLVAPAEFRAVASKLALAYGAAPLREGGPVLVQVRPLRVDGEGRPFLQALVREGKTITWLVRP